MTDKPLSTYDRIMKDPQRRFKFEQEYRKFVLVEILIPLLEKSKLSVRSIADSAGISPTVVQDIKSGKKEGISFSTFMSILKALGYDATIHINRTKRPRGTLRSRKRKKTSNASE